MTKVFRVELSNPSKDVLLGPRDQMSIKVIDNEIPASVDSTFIAAINGPITAGANSI